MSGLLSWINDLFNYSYNEKIGSWMLPVDFLFVFIISAYVINVDIFKSKIKIRDALKRGYVYKTKDNSNIKTLSTAGEEENVLVNKTFPTSLLLSSLSVLPSIVFLMSSLKNLVLLHYGNLILFFLSILLMTFYLVIFKWFYQRIYLRYIKKHIYNHGKKVIDEIPLDK